MNTEIIRYLQDNNVDAHERLRVADAIDWWWKELDIVKQIRNKYNYNYADKPDWLEDFQKAMWERVDMWIDAWKETFKSWIEWVWKWLTDMFASLADDWTFVREKDWNIDNWNREWENRVEQFWRWLLHAWWWAIKSVFWTVIWWVAWTITPEIMSIVNEMKKDKPIQDIMKLYWKLPLDVQETMSDALDISMVTTPSPFKMVKWAINASKWAVKWAMEIPKIVRKVKIPTFSKSTKPVSWSTDVWFLEKYWNSKTENWLSISDKTKLDIEKIWWDEVSAWWWLNKVWLWKYWEVDTYDNAIRWLNSTIKNYIDTLKSFDNNKIPVIQTMLDAKEEMKAFIKWHSESDFTTTINKVIKSLDKWYTTPFERREFKRMFWLINEKHLSSASTSSSVTTNMQNINKILIQDMKETVWKLIPNYDTVNKNIMSFNDIIEDTRLLKVLWWHWAKINHSLWWMAIVNPKYAAVKWTEMVLWTNKVNRFIWRHLGTKEDSSFLDIKKSTDEHYFWEPQFIKEDSSFDIATPEGYKGTSKGYTEVPRKDFEYPVFSKSVKPKKFKKKPAVKTKWEKSIDREALASKISKLRKQQSAIWKESDKYDVIEDEINSLTKELEWLIEGKTWVSEIKPEDFKSAKEYIDALWVKWLTEKSDARKEWNNTNWVKELSDTEKMKMYDKKIKEHLDKKENKSEDFRIEHRAPWKSEDNYNLRNVINWKHNQPKDYFDKTNWPRYYWYNDKNWIESFNAIKNAKWKDYITAYRAVPKDLKSDKLINWDWITFSEGYAKLHWESALNWNYKIIKEKIKLDNARWDWNDINEWWFEE